ncbi:K+-H+ exchange-like protein [Perilla frutescens var. hirtella]|nr:K+-H+ exchange-like protein [Perilla frutescens var. frutescens]KAH6793326.1 K+-H+ exchange-like protein [Perilla frutescens var. hirtella]
MRAKVVVFPITGRNWCFSRSIDPSAPAAQSSTTPSTLKEFWNKISSKRSSEDSKVELAVDFVANKMNGAWSKLEKAPQGTIKNKIHGLGLKLLSRVKPSEIFFKSIPKEINSVDIVYPSSLNPRLVRRRVRHIAFRGSVIHRKYFYVSAMLVPFTSVFMVLPLPNIPFFWLLFRAYSHWRASQGSEKLLHLVSDASCNPHPSDQMAKGEDSSSHSDRSGENSTTSRLVLQPSEELEMLIKQEDGDSGLSECAISKICQKLYLNSADVKKFRNSL